tara:strand:+ start:7813 stop:9087 length:1275 start_codon:yes stop_codon:yes gene_type:complete
MHTFQTGTFQNFKAISEFNFGPLDGITIAEGTEMAFDGTTLKMKGKEHQCPEFSLALKAKFCVPVADNTTQTPRHESQVQVHSATSHGDKREAVSMGTAVEEEKVVGSVSGTKDRRNDAQTAQDTRAKTAAAPAPAAPDLKNLSVEEADAINAANIAKELDKPVTKGVVGGTRHDSADEDDAGVRSVGKDGKYKLQVMDSHQGTVVGSVKSGKNSAAVGADGEATKKASADMRHVTAGSVEAGLKAQEGTVEGIKGLEAKSAAPQTGIRNVGAQVVGERPAIMENPPKPMQTTTVITEGEDIRSVRGAGTGDVKEARGTNEESVADLLPDAAVAEPPSSLAAAGAAVAAPKPPAPQQSDPEAEIAAIAAQWDRKRQWQKRVSEAVDFYGDWPEALEAIYGVESPAVCKHIKSRLAKKAAEAAAV